MKRFGFIVFILMIFAVSPVFALSIPKTHIVSVTWLAQQMKNPNLVIVDVRSQKAYTSGHIPGAVNIAKHQFFQKGYVGNIAHLLDTPSQIVKLFRDKGISNRSSVVFYGESSKGKSYAAATREIWTAWMYGLRKVALLRGGINAWKAANKKLSTGITKHKRGNFSIRRMHLNSIATWADIYNAFATKRVQLIDAREPAHYNGTAGDKRLAKHGHIPNGKEIATYEFTKKIGNHYELMNPKEIRAILKRHNVSLSKPIITYCNTGHLATGDWFAIKFLAGARHVKMYDGSMFEYSRMPFPVVK